MEYSQKVPFSFLLILFFCSSSLLAQLGKREITWNYLPDEHRDMVEYTFDKKAGAVVLYDIGIWTPISLEKDQIMQLRHRRIKVLKKKGVGVKDILLTYQANEKIKNLKARTINWENGKKKVTKLELKYLPEEEAGPDQKQKSFSFRNVTVGSIIEYQYELHTDAVEFLKPWYFQGEIPVLHSEVRLDNFRTLSYSAFPQVLEIEPYARGRFQMRHLRAFKEEPFVGNLNDYRIGLRFQLKAPFGLPDEQREWQLITMDLQEGTLFLDDSVTQNALYSLTKSLIREAITDEEKIAIIHKHISESIIWNGKSDTWMTKTPSKTYKDREGSSVEINMLLTQMLWLANLKASRLFYRTRDMGVPVFQPIRNQFNDMMVVVKADGQTFFLDATDPLRSYDLLPQRAINRMGWLVKDSLANWVKIPGKFPSTQNVVGFMSIKEDGSIMGECKEVLGGYKALHIRKQLQKQSPKEYLTEYLTDFDQITSQELKYITEPNLPVSVLFKAETSAFSQKTDKKLSIIPLLHYREKENPFPSKTRNYPIDFGHFQEKTILLSFLIPEGFHVEELPKNIRLKTIDDRVIYEFVCSHSGKTIQLRSSFQVKKAFSGAEDYPAIREVYQKMIEKQQEKIILIPSN